MKNNIEIGVVEANRKFRLLTTQQLKDHLHEVE